MPIYMVEIYPICVQVTIEADTQEEAIEAVGEGYGERTLTYDDAEYSIVDPSD